MRKLKYLLLILVLVPLMFAQYEIPIENLLTNSGFGVWSQADANAGIAALTYDTGSAGGGDIPDVGDAVTGGASGATGKIMSMTIAMGTFAGNNATGVIQLGSTTGCFNDDEALAFTDGETAIANHPDGSNGADKIVKNGAFVHDVDPPNDWTASNATLSTEVGGSVGNCMKVLDGGAGNGYGYQQVTTVVGKIYKFSCWAKDIDTGQDGLIEVGTAAGNAAYYSSGAITADAGATYTNTFEATTVTTFISLNCTTVGGTYYFDEVTLYEITDGCTGADGKALDLWVKDSTGDIYREHKGTNTKDGSFYALKMVTSNTYDYARWPSAFYNNEEWYMQFQGRVVTVGAWVKTLTANHARLDLADSVGNTSSSFHTGGGVFEWLEVTRTIDAGATSFRINIYGALAGTIDGNTIIYISQPMLSFQSSIGSGNYSPRQHEVIWLDAYILSSLFSGTSGWSDVGNTSFNLEADTDAKLPKGVKAIYVYIMVRDSASAGTHSYLRLHHSAYSPQVIISCGGLTNNIYAFNSGWQMCDADGDLRYDINATGANTFSVPEFFYHGVQVTD